MAIWDDGRIVFAKDPRTVELEAPAGKAPRGKATGKRIQNQGAREKEWTHELYEGAISADDLARLKKAIADTGVFVLKRTSALVPDAPWDYILVDIGGRQQLLAWDEHEHPNYGININPTPDDKKFIATWKEINRLALAARPTESTRVRELFQPPDSWREEPKDPE